MVQCRAARFAKHDYRCTTSVTKLLGELNWPVLSDRHREARLSLFSKAAICHLSQSSISAYEANTLRWSHKFYPHLCTNWCLQILVLSTYTSRLEHSVCWSSSQVLVVCKWSQLIWSTKPWHSSGKGRRPLLDTCWRTEELKSVRWTPSMFRLCMRHTVYSCAKLTAYIQRSD